MTFTFTPIHLIPKTLTMKVIPSAIPDVLIIEPKVFGDARGFFFETFNVKRYAEMGIPHTFVQDNHSRSAKGVLRGLHFQKQFPQGKLVYVTHGEVLDVAVDIRPNSPSFGKHVSIVLNTENHRQFTCLQALRMVSACFRNMRIFIINVLNIIILKMKAACAGMILI